MIASFPASPFPSLQRAAHAVYLAQPCTRHSAKIEFNKKIVVNIMAKEIMTSISNQRIIWEISFTFSKSWKNANFSKSSSFLNFSSLKFCMLISNSGCSLAHSNMIRVRDFWKFFGFDGFDCFISTLLFDVEGTASIFSSEDFAISDESIFFFLCVSADSYNQIIFEKLH